MANVGLWHFASPRASEQFARYWDWSRHFVPFSLETFCGLSPHHALLRNTDWVVNVKRVERICRHEGLKVPTKQPKRRRLWLNDGLCVRLRPEYPTRFRHRMS